MYEFDGEPVLAPNGELELDPDNVSCGFYSRPLFANCKNNCPGVNFPVVSGGFALLAATGIASTFPAVLTPILGGLGLMGAAGAAGLGVMAMTQCGGPIRCVSPGGQCCFLLISVRGPLCPAQC